MTNEILLLEIKVNELFIYEDEDGFERVKLNYDLTNKYEKLIKLVDHRLIIKDLLGDTITEIFLEKDLYLASNDQKNLTRDLYREMLGWSAPRLKK